MTTLLPALRDHHVHLGLIDAEALTGSALSAVDDLGWSLDRALAWRGCSPFGVQVRVAGPFLTAPGGYPFGRSWAPDDAALAIDSPATAVAAVEQLAAAGVDLIKVVLHTGLPLLGDHELAAVATTARRLGRPVVAHLEGPGQTARALAAGVEVLAHTPWTERLSDELVRALAGGTTIISSLAIHADDEHSYAVAVGNLARFHAAGGRVRYGTDLGNGPRAVGVDQTELTGLVDAGLDPAAIWTSIECDGLPGWVTWSPTPPPPDARELVDWFGTVRRCRENEL